MNRLYIACIAYSMTCVYLAVQGIVRMTDGCMCEICKTFGSVSNAVRLHGSPAAARLQVKSHQLQRVEYRRPLERKTTVAPSAGRPRIAFR